MGKDVQKGVKDPDGCKTRKQSKERGGADQGRAQDERPSVPGAEGSDERNRTSSLGGG